MSLAVTSNYFEADDLKPKPVVTFVNETTGVEIVSLRMAVVALVSCAVSLSRCESLILLRCRDDEGHTKPRVLPHLELCQRELGCFHLLQRHAQAFRGPHARAHTHTHTHTYAHPPTHPHTHTPPQDVCTEIVLDGAMQQGAAPYQYTLDPTNISLGYSGALCQSVTVQGNYHNGGASASPGCATQCVCLVCALDNPRLGSIGADGKT
jgi:hypothetical protein